MFRSKGVLQIEEKPNRYVFQGVYDKFELKEHLPWGNERKTSKIVFIGRNLKAREIQESFTKATQGQELKLYVPPQAPGPSATRLTIMVLIAFYLLYPETVKSLVTENVMVMVILALAVILIGRKQFLSKKTNGDDQ